MSVFVDTSALYAVMDADDTSHPPAREEWQSLLLAATPMVTTNYVMDCREAFAFDSHYADQGFSCLPLQI